MRAASFKPITTLVLPVVLPLVLAAVVLQRSLVPDSLERWLALLPPILFTVVAALCWRFNLSRIALSVLVVAASEQAVRFGASDLSGGLIFDVVSVLLPLHLVWLAWTSERGLLGVGAIVKLVAIGAPIALCAWLGEHDMATLTAVLHPEALPAAPPWAEPLGGTARLVWAAALAALGWRFTRHRTAVDGGFIGVLLATFLALTQQAGSQAFSVYFAAAGLVLLVSLIELSHALAYRDELTGLPGRRAFNDALERLPRRYTIAMVDVDHFKRFNDRFGHDVGDQALRMVACRLARVTGGGRAYRYGGEEFAVIFRGKGKAQTKPHLEAVRAAIADSPFAVRGADRPKRRPKSKKRSSGRSRSARSRRVRVTVSIGAACRDGQRRHADEVVQAADKRLYKAKKAGRNCLVS